MITKRTKTKTKRTRGLGSPPEAHRDRWESAHEAALEAVKRMDEAVAKGHCGRAGALLANAFYAHGSATAEARGAQSGGIEIPRALEGARGKRVFGAEDHFRERCVRKPSIVERAKSALRRKP